MSDSSESVYHTESSMSMIFSIKVSSLQSRVLVLKLLLQAVSTRYKCYQSLALKLTLQLSRALLLLTPAAEKLLCKLGTPPPLPLKAMDFLQ